jgi:hypothetical protein
MEVEVGREAQVVVEVGMVGQGVVGEVEVGRVAQVGLVVGEVEMGEVVVRRWGVE